jgi:D-beta-D-heptose 7-phosphate kinase/D-beta-D-heptose 1-phosphate adenosyltransferase
MRIAPDFSAVRVLVVGDVMLDRFWTGGTERISPEAPVPVVRVADCQGRPGGAGNVAVNLSVLGAGASLVGLCGRDEAAEELRATIEAAGVRWLVSPCDGDTVVKLRVLSRHQQLLRMDFEQDLAPYAGDLFIGYVGHQLVDSDVVVLSDYAKGTLAGVQEIIKAARERELPVLVDPKGEDLSRYRGATLLTPNLSEFEAVVGHCASDEDLVSKGEALRDQLSLEALLVTRSERGMTLLQRGQPALHLPARAREVYDVTGAGDTVISVLAGALGAGESLPAATALANAAAGVVVGKLGTAAVTRDELNRALAADLSESIATHGGVLSEAQLLEQVAQARASGERIVMTNGCFDLLHPGHIAYLREARALGDRLIVAVNDDASVKRLKGEDRPINSIAARMAVLS